MKRIATLIFIFAFAQMTFAQNLLVEDFNYSGGILGVNGWTATAVSPGTPALMTTTGLTYTGFSGSGIGNAANLGNTGEDLTKVLSSPVLSGSAYLTFMVNIGSATTTTGGYITGFTSGTTYLTNYNLRVFVKAVTGGFDFGVSRSSGTPIVFTGNTYTFNQTYLVTCKYTIGVAAITFDDVASIYVHPATPTLVEPATLSATFSGGTIGSDVTAASGLMGIYIRQGTAADNVTAVLDGFRVSTVWAETIPVQLVDFKAQKQNTAVKLAWSTATELNNAYYTIERSDNAKIFEKIGEVSGYGNSQQARTYSFMDEKPLNAVNYYRLRQVDFDGKETVYKTVSVHFGQNGTTKVYPTVAKDKINIEFSGDNGATDLMVVNLLGQVVKTQKLQNTEGVLPVNISDLPNGSYIVRLVSKNGSVSQRFEKQ